jgi:hypothetical protein
MQSRIYPVYPAFHAKPNLLGLFGFSCKAESTRFIRLFMQSRIYPVYPALTMQLKIVTFQIIMKYELCNMSEKAAFCFRAFALSAFALSAFALSAFALSAFALSACNFH